MSVRSDSGRPGAGTPVHAGIACFPRNAQGRDFVVGDLHGCFRALEQALQCARFDRGRDRLFAVGDLVDHGPDSAEVVDWLARPWFHAVRGNHDQMAIGVARGRHDRAHYAASGGAWFLALPAAVQKSIADALDALPLGIEIDHAVGRIGIVHASVPDHDWNRFVEALHAARSRSAYRRLLEQALWSRVRIQSGDEDPVAGVALVFTGHSVVHAPGHLANVVFVDTGAGYGGAPTVTDIEAWARIAAMRRRRRVP